MGGERQKNKQEGGDTGLNGGKTKETILGSPRYTRPADLDKTVPYRTLSPKLEKLSAKIGALTRRKGDHAHRARRKACGLVGRFKNRRVRTTVAFAAATRGGIPAKQYVKRLGENLEEGEKDRRMANSNLPDSIHATRSKSALLEEKTTGAQSHSKPRGLTGYK